VRSCYHDSEHGREVVGAAVAGWVVGPAEANGASSIPQNMKEAEVDAKMTTGLQATAAGHFSFIGQRYRDGGGVSRPQCRWS
jgi:hypothetical protein